MAIVGGVNNFEQLMACVETYTVCESSFSQFQDLWTDDEERSHVVEALKIDPYFFASFVNAWPSRNQQSGNSMLYKAYAILKFKTRRSTLDLVRIL